MAKKKKTTRVRSFVLDSSMAVAWCFPDEKASHPQRVLDSLAKATAIVPTLWHLEIANTLLVGERRKRCSESNTVHWTRFLSSLPIRVDEQTLALAWTDILRLGREQSLSAYDAAYLELALRRDLPLASLDDKLKSAAVTLGIRAYEP